MKQLIWIVDKDPKATEFYSKSLAKAYFCVFFRSLEEFQKAYFHSLNDSEFRKPNLVIFDYYFGEKNVLTYLAGFSEEEEFKIPFLVVSSIEDQSVIEACLDSGALDYFCKPVNAAELYVKLMRMFHSMPAAGTAIDVKEVIFSPETLSLRRGNKVLTQLTSKELQIFTILYRASGKTISRKQIEKQIWHTALRSRKTFDVHLFNLRKKLIKLNIEIRFSSPDGYTLISETMPVE